MSLAESPVERILDAAGPAAPPRSNGELVFQAPWESRVFGLTLVLHRQGRFEWEEFRQRLITAIAEAEARIAAGEASQFHYYTCWLEALRGLLAEQKLCAPAALAEREDVLAARPAGHDH